MIIEESLNIPCEGIFWVIDNQLISYMDSVGFHSNLEHSKIWNTIRDQYGNVSFNYYPRGRVMVNEVRDKDGVLQKYKAFIYIDDCINDAETVDEIKYRFCLTGNNCDIVYVGSGGGVTSNHYKCNNCR